MQGCVESYNSMEARQTHRTWSGHNFKLQIKILVLCSAHRYLKEDTG